MEYHGVHSEYQVPAGSKLTFQLLDSSTYQSALEQSSVYMDEHNLWFGHGTDNSWDEGVALLLWCAALPVDTGDEILDSVLAPEIAERFVTAVNRRVDERIPAPYITSEAWFFGLPFYVNTSVLIPRSPIAELIANDFQPWRQHSPKKILDLCCGSGCIGITAALANTDAEVWVSDLSAEAIDVAERNIQVHKCQERVMAICADLFADVAGKKFDLILCNPPYVDASDISSMPPEYKHEPAMGLGSGDDGLDITRQILAQAASYLEDGGLLILEVGNSWVHLEGAYPKHSFIWLEFEFGGEGVCVLTRDELIHLVG